MRAYVAAKQWPQAEAALRGLEPADANDAAAARQATQAMIRSGRDLQEQLQRLRGQKRSVALADFQSSLERFLWQVANRPQGNTFWSLQWVAEAYLGLGAALERAEPAGEAAPPEKMPPPALECYRDGRGHLSAGLLHQCETARGILPLAGCPGRPEDPAGRRACGAWASTGRRSPFWRSCSKTTTAWLTPRSRPRIHISSGARRSRVITCWPLRGVENTGKSGVGGNSPGGWRPTARSATTFCEARYNLALCRFQLAQHAATAAERAELLTPGGRRPPQRRRLVLATGRQIMVR